MQSTCQTLVFILDPASVRSILENWPRSIFLAVAMTADGNCELVVFHDGEWDGFPTRLASFLSIDRSDMVVIPEVPGFATAQFRYSDERRLMTLIREVPSVAEEACDYAANYDFALEEGLDPQSLVGLNSFAAMPVDLEPAEGRAQEAENDVPQLPSFMRRSAVARIQQTPEGDGGDDQVTFIADGPVIRMMISQGHGALSLSDPSRVFVSADQTSFALLLSGDDGLPNNMSVDAETLGKPLADRLAAGRTVGQVTQEGGFVIVKLKEQAKPSTATLVSFSSARSKQTVSFSRRTAI